MDELGAEWVGEAEGEFFGLIEEVVGVALESIDLVPGHESDITCVYAEEGAAHSEAVVGGFEDGAVTAEGDDEVDIAGVGEVLWVDGIDDVDEGGVCFDDIAEPVEGSDGLGFILVDQYENAAGHGLAIS